MSFALGLRSKVYWNSLAAQHISYQVCMNFTLMPQISKLNSYVQKAKEQTFYPAYHMYEMVNYSILLILCSLYPHIIM